MYMFQPHKNYWQYYHLFCSDVETNKGWLCRKSEQNLQTILLPDINNMVRYLYGIFINIIKTLSMQSTYYTSVRLCHHQFF